MASLLETVDTITLPAAAKKFIFRKRLVVDTSQKARVKIALVGSYFYQLFKEIEEPVVESTLRYARLTQASIDTPILSELGATAETMFSQIYTLMEKQGNGENGVLLADTPRRANNIFYIPYFKMVINICWVGRGWGVYDFLRDEYPDRPWLRGDQVFSQVPKI